MQGGSAVLKPYNLKHDGIAKEKLEKFSGISGYYGAAAKLFSHYSPVIENIYLKWPMNLEKRGHLPANPETICPSCN